MNVEKAIRETEWLERLYLLEETRPIQLSDRWAANQRPRREQFVVPAVEEIRRLIEHNHEGDAAHFVFSVSPQLPMTIRR